MPLIEIVSDAKLPLPLVQPPFASAAAAAGAAAGDAGVVASAQNLAAEYVEKMGAVPLGAVDVRTLLLIGYWIAALLLVCATLRLCARTIQRSRLEARLHQD